MEILITVLRWIAFLCLMSGLIYMAYKKLKIQLEFAPIFVCSSIAVFVFLGGIAGLLLISVYMIVIIGTVCFYFLLKNKNQYQFRLEDFSLVRITFVIGSLCFLIQLLQTELAHYDNYSHWAVVVKEMLITKAVPNADSVLIDFKNYPLGMSSFIYFVCEIIGHSQSDMLFAQGVMIFSCFCAIFGIISEKKRFLLAIFLATGCSLLSLFNISIRINNLLVDFILPILGLAILAVIYRYRQELNKAIIVICPMIGLLVVVKNTGIIYASVTIVYFIYTVIKYRKTSTQKTLMEVEGVPIYSKDSGFLLFMKTVGVIAISMITTVLWSVHVKYAFAGIENKFEIDASKLQGTYAGKTAEDVEYIIELFIRTVLDITSRPTIGIVLFEILAIVMCVVGIKVTKKKWMLPKVLISLNLMLVLYYAGILAMYIFSMPLYEALYLAGFERYACSIVIFFGGALTMCATIDMENSFYYRIGEVPDYRSFKTISSKNMYNNGVVICTALTLLILSSEYNGLRYHILNHENTLPAKVEAVVGDQWHEEVDSDRYLVYASDQDSQVTNYLLQYITKYYLRANQVDGLCYFYEDNMLNLLSQYDKLIIIEPDAEQQALMQKYLGVSGEAGIYELEVSKGD